MAFSTAIIQTPIATAMGVQTAATSTSTRFKNASTIFYIVDVDNTANSGPVFLKLYDHAGPTVGTTAPEMVLKIPATLRRTMLIHEGHTFGTALSVACVTTGGTAGTTSPTSAVPVRIVFT